MTPQTHYLKLGKEAPFRIYKVVIPESTPHIVIDRITVQGEHIVAMDTDKYWNIIKWIYQRHILKDKKAGCNVKKKDLEDYL